jgi:PAT family beta-lactamase induction signal transducer AmpG
MNERPEDVAAPEANPWRFVPSLYFMQGIPVVLVQQMSVTMYKSMGVDNARIGLWTSLISWPWIVKMLWGPLVDRTGTKRSWIVACQLLLTVLIAVAALTIQSPNFLAISLLVLFLIAFVSATHDIAADGFYLMALPEKAQAFFVGIRSAFFRLAMIFGTGALVVLAGNLNARNGVPIPVGWTIAILLGAGVYGLLYLWGLRAYPRPASDTPQAPFSGWRTLKAFLQIVLMLVALFLLGRWLKIGSIAATEALTRPTPPVAEYRVTLELPKASFEPAAQLERRLPDAKIEVAEGPKKEPWLKIALPAQKFVDDMGPDATEYLKDLTALPEAKPVSIERTGLNLATPLFLPTEPAMMVGKNAESFAGPIVVNWGTQAAASLAVLLAAMVSTLSLFRGIGMGPAAREYFTQNRILAVLGFILFYRFGESMIAKLSSPFLLDPPEKGGLGVPLDQVGWITGTFGVVALTAGGLLGGWLISKFGIKKCIWPMVLALNVPNLFYVWAALAKPGTAAVTGLITVDQFGYGFGFSAYMVYLMFLSQGAKHQTSHYAISTGLMALGAMVAGISSGYLQTFFAGSDPATSYARFFIAVCVCTIPGMLMLLAIPMDKADLKTAPVDID